MASWPEQRLQFLTRFLFALLTVYYFNYSPQTAPYWFPAWVLNSVLAAYTVFNAVNLFHAYRGRYGLGRCRLAMWIDLLMVSIFLVNDPYDIPPSLLAYVMVVLGNGMRYGLRMFGEALTGTFIGATAALAIRYWRVLDTLPPGLFFLPLFAGIIVLYSYILMLRIETSRRQLEKHSKHDPLTGLLNRRGLHASVELLFKFLNRDDDRVTVMFADMDNFKAVNDSRSHAEGDRVLQAVGRIFRTVLRPHDLMARYGGDEFVIVLPHTNREQAEAIARRLEEHVGQLAVKVGVDFGISFGLREAPVQSTDFNSLLDEVDQEMYRSKAGGARSSTRDEALVNSASRF